MEIFSNLALGVGVALSLQNLLYCFMGVLLGTLIGVLPGIGPVATIAMLLPVTFTLSPVSALIMLAGAGRARPWASRRSARSSPALSRRWSSRCSPRLWPRSR